MNHAFLIQVHAYPQLLLKIIERLNAPNHYFFIHIDKKSKSIFHSSIIEAIKLTDNVTIISDYKVNWGGRSQFVVTISLMRLALSHPVKMDYFHLISGQDFPLRSNQVFDRFFEKQSVAGYMGFADTNNMEYRFMVYHFNDFFNLRKRGVINKILIKMLSLLYEYQLYIIKGGIQIRPTLNFELFKGSQWWSLRRDAIVYINNFLNTHPNYLKRFKYTSCCDEIFFHVIIMNSQYRNEIVRNNLRYIDWTDRGRGEGLPLVLIEDDFERIMTMENCFFARKIQPGISDELINMILSNG